MVKIFVTCDVIWPNTEKVYKKRWNLQNNRHSNHLEFSLLFEKMYFNKEYMLFEARKQTFVKFHE